MFETLLFDTVDTLLFILTACSVGYLLFFAIAGMFKRSFTYPPAKKKYRYAVLFPAYKADKIIEATVESFLDQKYPKENYDIVVIADQLQNETIQKLQQLPIKLLIANFENSSKAKALNFAIDQLPDKTYDAVIILDADNTVQKNFLEKISDAYESGPTAIQAHRIAKNRNTDTAILDAVSEEINNTIFRKGHVKVGLSSALIGSGMVFDYKWFKENIEQVNSAGEDKELEILLLKQRIYIEYLEDVYVYDEKTAKTTNFSNQRRRWLAAQFSSLCKAIPAIPNAILSGNINYCDKVFQWIMLPRILLLGLTVTISIVMSNIKWELSIKWWLILFILLFALFISIPDYLVNNRMRKALRKAPFIAIIMFINLFRLKGVNKNFIHTEHDNKLNKI